MPGYCSQDTLDAVSTRVVQRGALPTVNGGTRACSQTRRNRGEAVDIMVRYR